jgi:hypothetical protein
MDRKRFTGKWQLSKDLRKQGHDSDTWGDSILGRGRYKYIGPEAGTGWMYRQQQDQCGLREEGKRKWQVTIRKMVASRNGICTDWLFLWVRWEAKAEEYSGLAYSRRLLASYMTLFPESHESSWRLVVSEKLVFVAWRDSPLGALVTCQECWRTQIKDPVSSLKEISVECEMDWGPNRCDRNSQGAEGI